MSNIKRCKYTSKKKTTEEFIEQAKKVHGDKYDYSNVRFKNTLDKVEIICKKHGTFLQAVENHIYYKNRCPKCILKAQSKIYSILQQQFPNLTFEWEASPQWLCPMRFDIYCSKYNFEIEYNGRQHYEPLEIFGGQSEFEKRLLADQKKTKLCEENGCKQFILRYDYTQSDLDSLFNNIKKIINNEN